MENGLPWELCESSVKVLGDFSAAAASKLFEQEIREVVSFLYFWADQKVYFLGLLLEFPFSVENMMWLSSYLHESTTY